MKKSLLFANFFKSIKLFFISLLNISFFFKSKFLGAVAQLAERMDGIHEVTGSTPVSSTSLRSNELRLARPERMILCKIKLSVEISEE